MGCVRFRQPLKRHAGAERDTGRKVQSSASIRHLTRSKLAIKADYIHTYFPLNRTALNRWAFLPFYTNFSRLPSENSTYFTLAEALRWISFK